MHTGRHGKMLSKASFNAYNIIQRVAFLSAILWILIFTPLIYADNSTTETADTIITILPEFEAFGQDESTTRVKNDGSVLINSKTLDTKIRKFGETDIIGELLSISGINKSGDYSSGITIDGASPSQTQYLIDGAPVIFPYRFGGIFSTFNSSHFKSALFRKYSPSEYQPMLGGVIDFEPKKSFSRVLSGEVNIGLLSSSANLNYFKERKFCISASGRISYIDQIYGKLLHSESTDIGYRFADLNLTASYITDRAGTFTFSAYHNQDKLAYGNSNYDMTMGMQWRNTLFNLKWAKKGDFDMESNIYWSGFTNKMTIIMQQFQIQTPNSLSQAGGRFNVSKKSLVKHIAYSFGTTFAFYKIAPLHAEITKGSMTTSTNEPEFQSCQNTNLININFHAGFKWDIVDSKLQFEPTFRIGALNSTSDKSHYRRMLLDPGLNIKYNSSIGTMTTRASLSSQFLHLAGFSELGLASDFWLGACKRAPLQRAVNFSLNWHKFLDYIGVIADANIYYSIVRNQTEYSGQVLEIADADYNALDHLIISDGFNAGGGISLRKEIGAITGHVGYEYGIGRRHRIGNKSDSWRSYFDNGNTVKAGIIWHPTGHWTFSADFRYADGRVYTPVKAIYVICESLAIEYAKHNSARMPAYQRLDLGATYSFNTPGKLPLKHLVNLSLINAYGHRNVEMQYFDFNTITGEYTTKRLYSLYRFLPSISYTILF